MKITHANPGTFDGVHWGHVAVVIETVTICGKITVVCSDNKDKDRWFSPEESKAMWKIYDLGENVKIVTFDEFMAEHTPDEIIVMIRGIRDGKDILFEQKIVEQNFREYNIRNYNYVIAEEKYRGFSSTEARRLAMEENLEKLEKLAHPKIAQIMIERAREIKRRKTQ